MVLRGIAHLVPQPGFRFSKVRLSLLSLIEQCSVSKCTFTQSNTKHESATRNVKLPNFDRQDKTLLSWG